MYFYAEINTYNKQQTSEQGHAYNVQKEDTKHLVDA